MIKKGLAALLLIAILAWGARSPEILRLHIIASSNSGRDQQIKLLVRDALMREQGEKLEKSGSAAQAEQLVQREAEAVLSTVTRTLKESGADYSARLSLGEYVFPTRVYAGAELPSGRYRALRVVLGEGGGKNWWCVLYPPLCILTDGNGEIDSGDIKLESYLLKLLKKADYKLWLKITGFLR